MTVNFKKKSLELVMHVIVDAEDLSTLAAERYISGFLIDAACLRYSGEPMRKNSHSLYLPSFTQTWALTRNVQFLQTKLKPYLLRMDLGDVVWTGVSFA